ncbi:MAG: MFS transporter [Arcobacteraceae bacterium]|nr:MFS transporter [Arcobacteraceae bacterium]
MTYKELFSNYQIVRKLTTIQFLAYFGTWFSNVAIYSMLVDFKASPILISIVVAMHFIPGILLSPFSGTIIDRIDAKKLMGILILTEFSMTMCFLLIENINDMWMLLIFIFIRMSASSMFFTTEMTLMPKILNANILSKVNEIHSMIWSFTFTAGMALGGFVVHVYGTSTAFIIDGVFFILAFLSLLNSSFIYQHELHHEKIWHSIKSGIRYLKENKHLLHLILLHGTIGVTSFDTIVTLLADYHYKYIIAVPLAIGFTNATRSIALMIGPLLISKWLTKERLFYIFLLQGVGIIIWAVVQKDFYFGLVGFFLTGFWTTTLWSYTYALLQERVEQKYLGRVLAYNEMFFMLINAGTTIFIGFMALYFELSFVTIILGLIFILMAFYYKNVILKL